jgi:hypothetical protein
VKDLLTRISSRKFLLAAAAAVTLAANRQWTEFTALVLGYLGLNIVEAKVTGSENQP